MSMDTETIYRGGGENGNHWAHVSAGGILLRHTEQGFQVFLLKEDEQADGWNFPRGTMSDQGSVKETTLREVEEEAGYSSRIIAYLGAVTSSYIDDDYVIDKTTLYHVLAPIKQVSEQLSEHQQGQWFAINDVAPILRQVTARENEHQLWQNFLRWLSLQNKDTLLQKLS